MAGNGTCCYKHGDVIFLLLSRVETPKYQLCVIFLILEVYMYVSSNCVVQTRPETFHDTVRRMYPTEESSTPITYSHISGVVFSEEP